MSYAKLRGRIKELYGTIAAFANAMKMDTSTVSSRLNNKSSWRLDEIERACELLEIPIEQVYEFFFTKKVAK